MHRRSVVVTVVAVLLALAGAVQTAAGAAGNSSLAVPRGTAPALSTAEIARLTQGALQRSIIIFKNQHADVPFKGATKQARVSDVDADQSGVRSELAQLRAPVTSFHIVNAAATRITAAEIARLRSNPEVQAVVPDLQRRFDTVTNAPTKATTAAPPTPAQQICPSDPSQPILEPEALQVMHVENQPGDSTPAAHDLVDGTGVKVGIIADGLDPNNPDFIRNGQSVIFDFRDFSGYGNGAPTDGRESFLDAGTIASQANQTYDLSGFVNPAHPLAPGCNIKIKGIAPGASLAVMNVAGSAPGFFNSQIVQAIEWTVGVDNVNVLNESFGGSPIPDTHNDPVALANQAAVAAGVTVVASTGDAGPTNTIGSPTSAPGIINAGGTTTLRVYRQTTRYGTNLVPGGWLNNNITALSSAGVTEFGPRTVDVVAPGDRGWSLCSSDTAHFVGCADIDHGTNPPPIWAAGGTSASSPETSATAALVIQAFEKTHNGAAPSPDLVKRIIVSSATDLGAPADHEGAGLVNTLKAVQLAESISTAKCNGNGNGNNCKPNGVGVGNGLLVNPTSLIATGAAGSTASFNVSVTNEGAGTQTITPRLFDLNPTPTSTDTGSVSLSPASPTYIDGEGNTDRFAEHTFLVPAGADYLNGDIAWDAATTPTAAFETLFDPLGRVAGYSLLGTAHSGHGHIEVRQPLAGAWTAVIFTVVNMFVYTGNVNFSYTTQNFEQTGNVSPSSLTLARGQTGSFVVTANFGPPGDEARNLRITTGGSDDGAIPMLLRSLIPLGSNGGTFAGTLTGGGVTSNAGQRFSYQFNVNRGVPDLNVAVHLRDPNYNIEGFLTDPNGEPLDLQSTAVIDNGNLEGYGNDLQFFDHDPQPGLWTLSLLVAGPIDGQHLTEPYTGSISFTPPPVTASGVPNSPSVKLAQGVPVTAQITVQNTGGVNKDFFVDPRLNGRVLQTLAGSDTNDVPLPLPLTAQPNWIVPTHTDAFAVVAQGTVPIVMDVSYATGDPDVLGFPLPDNGAAAVLQAPEVAPGFFFALPNAQGPFPDTGVGTASVDLAAVANTNPFDSAVTSDTGDLWALSVDPTGPYSPITLAPGASGTINVTITPDAPKNSIVRGFIAVDTFNLASFSGDEIALIPYSYQVR